MTSQQALDHALLSADSFEGLFTLATTLGWPDSALQPVGRRTDRSLLLVHLAGTPAILLTATEAEESPEDQLQTASLGYSSEAPLALAVTLSTMTLHRPVQWAETPGDSPVATAKRVAAASARSLLTLLSPAAVSTGTAVSGRKGLHPPLHTHLARALASLRAAVLQEALLAGGDPVSDLGLLGLFHKLLFVRVSEDRHDAPDNAARVSELLADRDPRAGLTLLLQAYERHYDSELFESPSPRPQDLPATPVRELLTSMVEPWERLRLDFSLTRSDLSGRLYESYLGLRPGKAAQTETLFDGVDLSDQRARTSAYYTPAPLARRVVEEALRPWLEQRRPQQPQDVGVLDPACGSGAFLLAAFRELRDYFERLHGRSLSADERRQLLTTSIHGADIDMAALMLARVHLLEEADLGSVRLPDLSVNLLWGDSLASPPWAPATVSTQGDASALPLDWRSWLAASGGVDVVLMNPPFGAQRGYGQRADAAQRATLRELYPRTRQWGTDLAARFIELVPGLLRPGGAAGFVLPRTLLHGPSGSGARELLLELGVQRLLDLRGAPVFPSAAAQVCVVATMQGLDSPEVQCEFVLDSRGPTLQLLDQSLPDTRQLTAAVTPSRAELRSNDSWAPFALRWRTELSQDVRAALAPLGDTDVRVVQGTQTGANDRFLLSPDRLAELAELTDPERLHAQAPLLLRGREIRPYRAVASGDRLLLPTPVRSLDRAELDLVVEVCGGYPKNVQPGALDVLLGPKVLLAGFRREPAAVADLAGDYIIVKGAGGGVAFGAPSMPARARAQWLLGVEVLLNSALYQWWLRGTGAPRHDETIELSIEQLRTMPWPQLAPTDWSTLARAGTAVRRALTLESPRGRTEAYWAARAEADALVDAVLDVQPRLSELVRDELLREG
ncbi:MAG: N-6 DNA methylase [Mycobacteriales bacterium]